MIRTHTKMTLKNVSRLEKSISDLLRNGENTVGKIFLLLNERGENLSAEQFVSLLLVSQGHAIPQTAMESAYPSVEYIRFLPTEDQKRILIGGESVALVLQRPTMNPAVRTKNFREIGKRECPEIFGDSDSVRAARRLVKHLKNLVIRKVAMTVLSNSMNFKRTDLSFFAPGNP